MISAVYTKQDVADLLKVNVRTIERLMSSGALGFSMVSAKPRITSAHVQAYLDSTERPAKSVRKPSRKAHSSSTQ